PGSSSSAIFSIVSTNAASRPITPPTSNNPGISRGKGPPVSSVVPPPSTTLDVDSGAGSAGATSLDKCCIDGRLEVFHGAGFDLGAVEEERRGALHTQGLPVGHVPMDAGQRGLVVVGLVPGGHVQ